MRDCKETISTIGNEVRMNQIFYGKVKDGKLKLDNPQGYLVALASWANSTHGTFKQGLAEYMEVGKRLKPYRKYLKEYSF